jgi:radical SAM superfamily enzyme YgiQ (UPF0313 family)
MSFGVEAMSPITLKQVGRRPIPQPHQRAMLARCRELGIVTAAFYVLGFLDDTRDSINATIDHSVALGSTIAQFKLLTPYPGTPLYGRMKPLITECDWQQFDGFTQTFDHPSLTRAELQLLLGSAYTRFYIRPSFLTNYLRIKAPAVRSVIGSLDARVERRHARRDAALWERGVAC